MKKNSIDLTINPQNLIKIPLSKRVAQGIVDYRKKHGNITEIDDLLKVKGIGPKTLEKIKRNLL